MNHGVQGWAARCPYLQSANTGHFKGLPKADGQVPQAYAIALVTTISEAI